MPATRACFWAMRPPPIRSFPCFVIWPAGLPSWAGRTWVIWARRANSAGVALAGALPHRGAGGVVSSPVGLDAAAMLTEKLAAYLLLNVEPALDSAYGRLAGEAMASAEVCGCDHALSLGRVADIRRCVVAHGPVCGEHGQLHQHRRSAARLSRHCLGAGRGAPGLEDHQGAGRCLCIERFSSYHTLDDVVAELDKELTDKPMNNMGAWRRPGRLADR